MSEKNVVVATFNAHTEAVDSTIHHGEKVASSI